MDPPRAGTAILADARKKTRLRFENPVERIVASSPAEVLPALHRLEARVNADKLIAVGFVSYDAAPAFDPALSAAARTGPWPPLLHFNLYCPQDRSDLSGVRGGRAKLLCPRQLPAGPPGPGPRDWTPSVSDEVYRARINAIRNHIRHGDTYQVNYTLRLHAPVPRDPESLFENLVCAQRPAYGAFLREANGIVCSASPELFFRLEGGRLISLPMKGTAPRGLWPEQDRQRAVALRRSIKNRAENLMIVDMVRNDMGRIARIGSVRAAPLCELEAYPNVWQMVSRVSCRTDAGLADVFAALFPAASITGAPKARTMQIIRDLESEPRGVYCGAIGFVAPGRRACFNVAIRTVSIDLNRGLATYGVGGGIVWDSRSRSEYDECRHKASILNRPPRPAVTLLETLRWTPRGGFFLLSSHLGRLKRSARHFGFSVDARAMRRQLQRAAAGWPRAALRVRLLVPEDGRPRIETGPLPRADAPARLVLAAGPVDAADLFLYHKTMRRELYDHMLAEHPQADDVLLWNSRGEMTESCIANLLIRIDGRWFTPPQRCGLLAGTYRGFLLRRGLVRERVVRVEDLPADPSDLRLINGLRRSRRVVWAAR